MHFLVPEKTFKSVLSYIINRPYSEVKDIIEDLKKARLVKDVVDAPVEETEKSE